MLRAGFVMAMALFTLNPGEIAAQEVPLPRPMQPRSWSTPDLPGRLRARLGLRKHRTRAPRNESGGEIRESSPVDESAAPPGSSGGGGVSGALVATIFIAAGIGVAVVAIALYVSQRDPGDRDGAAKSDGSHDTDWIARGDAALADGRFLDALRSYYLHGVHTLRRAGLAPLAHHTTDGLILSRMSDPEMRRYFADLSRSQFQPVGYGGQEASRDSAEAARELALGLETRIEERQTASEDDDATG